MRKGEREIRDILYDNGYHHALQYNDEARTFDLFTGKNGPIILQSYGKNGEDGYQTYIPVSLSNDSDAEREALLKHILGEQNDIPAKAPDMASSDPATE